MKFYGILFLLLAFVKAQDDNPTGDDIVSVTNPPTNNVPTVVDDNPSQSDVLEGKTNGTVSLTPTPSLTPRVDDSSLKNNDIKNMFNRMYVLAMMFMM